jgi:hypothetical protein
MQRQPGKGFRASVEESMIKPTTSILLAISLLSASSIGNGAQDQQEPEPSKAYVQLKLEGTCDIYNTRLWLVNSHTFKTVMTTIRWKAHGGKDRTEQFHPLPNSVREIGCAAEAEIVDTKFADF